MKADESKINVIYGKLNISFLIVRGLAAKFTPEDEGLADQGWTANHDIMVPSVQITTVRQFLKPL